MQGDIQEEAAVLAPSHKGNAMLDQIQREMAAEIGRTEAEMEPFGARCAARRAARRARTVGYRCIRVQLAFVAVQQ